jgi:hypothetical protein
LTTSIPRIGQHGVERVHELSGAVADEESKPREVFAVVHDQVAGLLCGPCPVGVRGHAQDVQEAVTDLEREQDVEPPQRHRAVDMEEVDREHVGGLRAQELPPTGVGMPNWGRWYPVTLQDLADRRGADAVAELEQLALDPLVSPLRVLRRHPHDQRSEHVVDRWATGTVRVGPLAANEAAVPAQDRVGVTRRWQRSDRGSRWIRAANTARSAQSRRGRGLVRRSTATSCRSTSSSMSLVEDGRPSSKTSLSTCRKSRYSSRSDTAAIMPDRRRPPITAGQQRVPRSGARLPPPAKQQVDGRERVSGTHRSASCVCEVGWPGRR